MTIVSTVVHYTNVNLDKVNSLLFVYLNLDFIDNTSGLLSFLLGFRKTNIYIRMMRRELIVKIKTIRVKSDSRPEHALVLIW